MFLFKLCNLGDDPKDVKARLKLWAQAVAASASRYGTWHAIILLTKPNPFLYGGYKHIYYI